MRPEIDLGSWAGLGGESEYVDAPVSDAQGHLTYKLVSRFGQGLLFRLRPAGLLYAANPVYIIGVAVAIFLSLSILNVVMDVIVKFLIPGGVSRLMKAKKSEIVSKEDEDRELGMKAALAAAAFGNFDPDGNGLIEMEDIVRVFAQMDMPGLDAAKVQSSIVVAEGALVAAAVACSSGSMYSSCIVLVDFVYHTRT